jgi:transcriptional regulator with XRE-family HTH domain
MSIRVEEAILNDNPPNLGTIMRALRDRYGWTLKEMSQHSGIPFSTLSKVENGRLTLTYDKLQQVSQRLKIPMSELFAMPGEGREPQVTGRRSIGRMGDAVRVTTPNYDYYYLNTELRRKRMIPIVTRIRAKSLEEFGELVRHKGEEMVYVIKGAIEVHTEFYDPVVINEGELIYIDSSMGHAYLVADGCDEALTLGVCSADDEALAQDLMSLLGETAAAS